MMLIVRSCHFTAVFLARMGMPFSRSRRPEPMTRSVSSSGPVNEPVWRSILSTKVAFGFERDKFEVSQALAERVLLPAVRAAGERDLLVSNGFSCREQISQNTPRAAVHLAEVLAGDC